MPRCRLQHWKLRDKLLTRSVAALRLQDFGLDEFDKLKARTQFPWLCANVTIKESGQPLGHCQRYKVIDHGGVKVGVMGLVEREWLDTLTVVEEEEIEYTDFVACARELVPTLRAEGADVVIALTHMRLPNDERLMREVQEVDLLLGGHDHDYVVRWAALSPLLCSHYRHSNCALSP